MCTGGSGASAPAITPATPEPPRSPDWTDLVIGPLQEQWNGLREGRVIEGPTQDDVNKYNSFGYPRALQPGVMHPDTASRNGAGQIVLLPTPNPLLKIPLAPRFR